MDMEFNDLQKVLDNMVNDVPCNWGVMSRNLTEADFKTLKTWVGHRLDMLNRLSVYVTVRSNDDPGHETAIDATRF